MSQTNAPIIFLHRGASSYLLCALWQAHHRNPDNEVILIGNWNPQLPFVTFEPISLHAEAGRAFRDAYVHLSTIGYESERSYLERWLIIESFVTSRGLSRFVHADSDLMLYCSVDDYFGKFDGLKWAMSRTSAHSAHLLFVDDPSILSDFCRYVMRMYLDAELFARLYKHYRWHRENGGRGGIGDMAALTFFIGDGHGDPYSLNRIMNGSVFDHSMREARLEDKVDAFRMSNGIKQVVIDAGCPWFVGLDGKMVRALSLHFQGVSKKFLRQFTESPSARIRAEYVAARIRERTTRRFERAEDMGRHYTGGAAKRVRRLVFGSQTHH